MQKLIRNNVSFAIKDESLECPAETKRKDWPNRI